MHFIRKIFKKVEYAVEFAITYPYGEIWHTPKKQIPEDLATIIKTYGVIHFGESQYKSDTLKFGLLAKYSKPLCPQEKDMIWLYPNYADDKVSLAHFWNIIRKKGKRKKNDAVYFFRNLTDEQIAHMRIRPSDEAIGFIGDFASLDMSMEYIKDVLPNTNDEALTIWERILNFFAI